MDKENKNLNKTFLEDKNTISNLFHIICPILKIKKINQIKFKIGIRKKIFSGFVMNSDSKFYFLPRVKNKLKGKK